MPQMKYWLLNIYKNVNSIIQRVTPLLALCLPLPDSQVTLLSTHTYTHT